MWYTLSCSRLAVTAANFSTVFFQLYIYCKIHLKMDKRFVVGKQTYFKIIIKAKDSIYLKFKTDRGRGMKGL